MVDDAAPGVAGSADDAGTAIAGVADDATAGVAGFADDAAGTAGKTAPQNEGTVYRVFGGDARAQGFLWTPVDPRTVSNFRNGEVCYQADRVEPQTRRIFSFTEK